MVPVFETSKPAPTGIQPPVFISTILNLPYTPTPCGPRVQIIEGVSTSIHHTGTLGKQEDDNPMMPCEPQVAIIIINSSPTLSHVLSQALWHSLAFIPYQRCMKTL